MVYLLKVNVLLAVFYGFYRLLFTRDTFFVWRRVQPYRMWHLQPELQ